MSIERPGSYLLLLSVEFLDKCDWREKGNLGRRDNNYNNANDLFVA